MCENNNWIYYISKNFNSFKNLVIEEMIKFYGKKYRDIIVQRLNEVNFIFYGTLKNNIPSKKQSFSGKKDIIYQTKNIDYGIDTRERIRYEIDSKLISFNASYDFNTNTLNQYILIPLFATDEDIIHEMIHAVTYNPMYIIESNEVYKGKCGMISTNEDGEILLEESITELEAKTIYKSIHKNINKTFLNPYENNKSNSYYDHFITLISKFHKTFFKEITYSRISLNKNYLINTIGKDLYLDFINYVSCYAEDLYSLNKEKYYPLINISIDKMKNNYKVKKLI